MDELNALATEVLGHALRVHSELGPGLLESSYKACLAFELIEAGFQVEMEVPVPLVYKGRKLADVGYRLDLIINSVLILEIKSVEAISPVHKAQLLSYLRHSKRRLGYVLNFNTVLLKDGMARIINGY